LYLEVEDCYCFVFLIILETVLPWGLRSLLLVAATPISTESAHSDSVYVCVIGSPWAKQLINHTKLIFWKRKSAERCLWWVGIGARMYSLCCIYFFCKSSLWNVLIMIRILVCWCAWESVHVFLSRWGLKPKCT